MASTSANSVRQLQGEGNARATLSVFAVDARVAVAPCTPLHQRTFVQPWSSQPLTRAWAGRIRAVNWP